MLTYLFNFIMFLLYYIYNKIVFSFLDLVRSDTNLLSPPPFLPQSRSSLVVRAIKHRGYRLVCASLSIRRFWGKGERWKRKRERCDGEKPSFLFSPSPLPHLKSPLP